MNLMHAQGPPGGGGGIGGDGCAYINGYTTICPGETTTLSAAGGTGYNWSTGGGSSSITVPAGTYTVTVSGGGCNNSVTVEVVEDASCTTNVYQLCQTVNDADIRPDRNDYSHNVSGDVSEGYILNFPPPTPPSGLCNLTLSALDITIELFDVNDNTAPDCNFFSNFGNVYVDCNVNQICPVVQDVLTSGCDNFGTGSTTPGVSSLDLLACNPGVADVNSVIGVDIVPAMAFLPGCPSNETAISDGLLSVNYTICIDYTYSFAPPLIPDVSDISIACPQTVTLGNDPIFNIEGINYSWSSGASGTLDLSGGGQDHGQTDVTPTATTTYTVTLSDGAGCTGTDEVWVTVGSGPTIDIGNPITICDGQSATIGGAPVSDIGNDYSWSSGDNGTVSVTDNGQIVVAPSSNTTYILTISDADNCTSTSSVDVNVTPPPIAIIEPALELGCNVNTVDLDASNSSSGPSIDYNWSGPGIVSGGTTTSPTINTAGTYTITVTNTSSNCSATSTVTVSSSATADINFIRH